VSVATARNGDVEIAYETFGSPSDEPLLLVMVAQRSDAVLARTFCAALTDHGFAVTRFDNRDSGLSTRFSTAGIPSLYTMLSRPEAAVVYRLEDMADDAMSVLDALGWNSAHVVGVSLGGMIAQTIAICYPAATRTLTCISSTPYWRIGRKKLATSIRSSIVRLSSGRRRTAEHVADLLVRGHRVIASPRYPLDEPWLREVGRRMFERGGVDRGAARRQGAAILGAGDRRRDLACVNVPTLVLHGQDDPLIAGRALAAAIPEAKLVTSPAWATIYPATVADHHQRDPHPGRPRETPSGNAATRPARLLARRVA
jgi:pimeloyl-ACP methyl ester carboxylesterase